MPSQPPKAPPSRAKRKRERSEIRYFPVLALCLSSPIRMKSAALHKNTQISAYRIIFEFISIFLLSCVFAASIRRLCSFFKKRFAVSLTLPNGTKCSLICHINHKGSTRNLVYGSPGREVRLFDRTSLASEPQKRSLSRFVQTAQKLTGNILQYE